VSCRKPIFQSAVVGLYQINPSRHPSYPAFHATEVSRSSLSTGVRSCGATRES
jgi:hypothetical protein